MTGDRPIDLRSDTVTRPDAAMRMAMADAEVGEDAYGEDPTVNRLQRRSAELFGREAALFVPSGTMANLLALLAHSPRGSEVILERRCHIYNYEMASMAGVAGLLPRVVEGERGFPSRETIESEIRAPGGALAPTGLVCLENTHNMAGGTVLPTELAEAICEVAHARGLPVHLDGARIFNAATALGRPVDEITRPFDSVCFCFSKALGAPVGSMLLGESDWIAEAHAWRRRLGGAMHQAGVLAAAALVALERSPGRLEEDHRHARRIAEALAELPGIEIDPQEIQTNIVIFEVTAGEMDAREFTRSLETAGVLAIAISKTLVRLVTHRDVGPEQIDRAIEALETVAGRRAGHRALT